MSHGPKKSLRSGTEHINKPETSLAWHGAELDAERAEKLHDVPQHLKVAATDTSRAGEPKQPPKHKIHPSGTAQPGFEQDLIEKQTKNQPKHAQGTEAILKQF